MLNLKHYLESTRDVRSERIKTCEWKHFGEVLRIVETSLRTNSRIRSIALRFYNARSRSGSDGPTMSVPMARGTLCQATERILIITRTRYISSGVYADNGEVFENERPAICVSAQFNQPITRITS